MKIAIIGASGKTGTTLVREALKRGHQVVAVCRTSSAERLRDVSDHEACTVIDAPVVSDVSVLTQALAGCDAVVAVLISVGQLKASDLVTSLAEATATNGVTRLVFTAGEITVTPEAHETFTLRQKIMLRVFSAISFFTPFSLTDMIRASVSIRQNPDWNWTIIRAPTLNDAAASGYRLSELHDVTSKHALSRQDYSACMLESLDNPGHHRRTLTVLPDRD